MVIFLVSSVDLKEENRIKSKEYVPCCKNVLEDFKAVENPIYYYLLTFLPLLSLTIMLLLLISKILNFFNDNKLIAWLPIIISAYFVAGICLFAQRLFMNKIPETFCQLWCRKVIVSSFNPDSYSNNIKSKDFEVKISQQKSLDESFKKFVNDIQKELNNPKQWGVGIFFVSLTFLWNPLNTLIKPDMWTLFRGLLINWNQIITWRNFIQYNWHLLNEIPVFLIALLLGLMVWKMIATSISISKLVEKFQVEPKLGHPDKAGGLSPLGNLCLWNCFIATIPTIYLSCWLLIGNLGNFGSLYGVKNYYTYEFLILLLVASILPFLICFVWPVWKVHQQMNIWKNSKSEKLCQIGHSIHQLESKLLNDVGKLNRVECKSILKELEEMKKVYSQNEKLPTWPFNIEILGKLSITYAIPILTVISEVNSLINSVLAT